MTEQKVMTLETFTFDGIKIREYGAQQRPGLCGRHDMIPNRATIERLRAQYPHGARVELVRMDDPTAPPAGTLGTVVGVDDVGSIMVDWDNSSGLNVVYGEDICRRIV